MTEHTIVVQGATSDARIPHLRALVEGDGAGIRFATTASELAAALPGADVLLGWDFRAGVLADAWPHADRLRWIHWSGAGVDAALFPALTASEVVLTNARGVFDRAMAEYVLGLVLAFAKGLPETLALQATRTWRHRLSERVDGRCALLIGIGSIGREVARLLRAVGMRVEGLGRTARGPDPELDRVHPPEGLHEALGRADYVVVVTPLTPGTRGLIGAAELAAMRPHARLVNVGRGGVVDEPALVSALSAGVIAEAAVDVFDREPLAPEHPLWGTPNLLVSPHMSGDYREHAEDLGWLFAENYRRYAAGRALLNVVDKRRGY